MAKVAKPGEKSAYLQTRAAVLAFKIAADNPTMSESQLVNAVAKAGDMTPRTARAAVRNIGVWGLGSLQEARTRILENLAEIDEEAHEDRNHDARIRANLSVAKILGIDSPQTMTPEETRERWQQFLEIVNASAESLIQRLGEAHGFDAGDALEEFRSDLRARLVGFVDPG